MLFLKTDLHYLITPKIATISAHHITIFGHQISLSS
jgi:hypothetical protein